ncbi:MAG: D-tagatose-bisphosphate aldolase, class II, non-catalytic subunit [Psychrosphaera sp.]|nr:D-tagatose-bisphosphate aldolase, class II, non-catalytic subunit [Psychrosphaera sp.]
MSPIQQLVKANRSGQACGIYAVCSAHPLVLEAAIEQAKADQQPLLIEATANQVNQFGGYTGMKPADFHRFVVNLAEKHGLGSDQIILGGDHLGPVCWQNESADDAMTMAHQLIGDYVAAGFKKIHLDCSMPCVGDVLPLCDDIIAQRAAALCATGERAAIENFGFSDVVYVIGTEVPPPGGANKVISNINVTTAERALLTLVKHQQAFENRGLAQVWPRVIGLVVQPGVEFDHTSVIDYQPQKAQGLKALIPQVDHIVFEAHSTDYQKPESYHQLVRDHFAILKVGPQLTFALREALFALSYIEEFLFDKPHQSGLRQVCEQQMLDTPKHWQAFYQSFDKNQPLYRHFSYSDRIRYYWPDEKIRSATAQLFKNLESIDIPLPLISQFMPQQYHAIRAGDLDNSPKTLVKAKIKQITQIYAEACRQQPAVTKEVQ